MSLKERVEELFVRRVAVFTESADFKLLESGEASRAEYDRFIENVFRCHVLSPHFLSFLLTLAPPDAVASISHNLLEEMGIEEESGESHPAILRRLAEGAGLAERLKALESRARDDLRSVIVAPVLYGTLRNIGLAVMCEVVSYEYMLSRVASRIARALQEHRGLSQKSLEWFSHHAEVDIRHAEEGIENLEAYARYYEIDLDDAMAICEASMRGDIFGRRYFGARGLRLGAAEADS